MHENYPEGAYSPILERKGFNGTVGFLSGVKFFFGSRGVISFGSLGERHPVARPFGSRLETGWVLFY